MADSDLKNNPPNNRTTSEEQEDNFQFKILMEEESSEDAFEDGAHQRIADSLYDVITSQEHSANIGLSGEWGSGKSTVIRMLKEKMDKNRDYLFFIFDSWAYEKDSLRIDFLLEFIHEIMKFYEKVNKKLDIKKRKEKIKENKKEKLLSKIEKKIKDIKKKSRQNKKLDIKKRKEKIKENKKEKLLSKVEKKIKDIKEKSRQNKKENLLCIKRKSGSICINKERNLKENKKNIKFLVKEKDIVSGKAKIEKKSENKDYSILGIIFILIVSLTTFGNRIIDFFLQDSGGDILWTNYFGINDFLYFLILPFVYFCVILRERVFRNIYCNYDVELGTTIGENPHKNEIFSIIISIFIDIIAIFLIIQYREYNFDSIFVIKYFLITTFPFVLGIPFCNKKTLFCNIGIFNNDMNESIIHTEEHLSINNYAYEFKEKFIEILNCFIQNIEKYQEKSKFKIVIVLDNLDRISATKALECWSLMQIFMQRKKLLYSNENKVDCLNQVWFIVPYDENVILRLWDTHNINEDSSRSFLEKSFQIRIDVPSLRLSSENDYMNEMLKKLNIPESEHEKIRNILFLTRRKKNKAITSEIISTPRMIKSYLNQIAFYYSVYGKYGITYKSIAYYVLLRFFEKPQLTIEVIKLIIIGIVPEYLNENRQKELYEVIERYSLNDEKIKKEIAGIIHGCEAEKGMELLVGYLLNNYLQMSNDSNFDRNKIYIDTLLSKFSKSVWAFLINELEGYDYNPIQIMFFINLISESNISQEDISKFVQYYKENLESKWSVDEEACSKVYTLFEKDKFMQIIEGNKNFINKNIKFLEEKIKSLEKKEKLESEKNSESQRDLKSKLNDSKELLRSFIIFILKKTVSKCISLDSKTDLKRREDIHDILEKYLSCINAFSTIMELEEYKDIKDKVKLEINNSEVQKLLFDCDWNEKLHDLVATIIVLPFVNEESNPITDFISSWHDFIFESKGRNLDKIMLFYCKACNYELWVKRTSDLCEHIKGTLLSALKQNQEIEKHLIVLLLFVSYKEELISIIYRNLIKEFLKETGDINSFRSRCKEYSCLMLMLLCICYSSLDDNEKNLIDHIVKYLELDENKSKYLINKYFDYLRKSICDLWLSNKQSNNKNETGLRTKNDDSSKKDNPEDALKTLLLIKILSYFSDKENEEKILGVVEEMTKIENIRQQISEKCKTIITMLDKIKIEYGSKDTVKRLIQKILEKCNEWDNK